jgi:hypothetical protein
VGKSMMLRECVTKETALARARESVRERERGCGGGGGAIERASGERVRTSWRVPSGMGTVMASAGFGCGTKP